LRIPNSFKTKIADTFYDKEITLKSYSEVVDDEGWADAKASTEVKTFDGNVRFDNLAQIQEDFGLDEDVDIIITTDEELELGNVIEYGGIEYRVISAIPYDSHNLIAGMKWSSKSTT
jgi:hypothetical protein